MNTKTKINRFTLIFWTYKQQTGACKAPWSSWSLSRYFYIHITCIYIYIYTWKESNKRTRHLMYRHTVEKQYIFGSLSLMSCRIYVTNTYYTRLVRNILTPYYYPSMRWTTNALLVYWFSAWSVVKTCTHSYTHTEARFELYNMLHLLCVTNHSNSSCV